MKQMTQVYVPLCMNTVDLATLVLMSFSPQTAYLTVMLFLKFCPLRYPFHRKFTVVGLLEKNIKATGILQRLWPNPHFCNCNYSGLHMQYVCCCCAHNIRRAETPPLLQRGGTQPRAHSVCLHFWVPSIFFGVSEKKLRSLLAVFWLITHIFNQANRLNTHTAWTMGTASLMSICLSVLPDKGCSQARLKVGSVRNN